MSDNRKINVLQLIEGLSFGGAETKLLELIARMDRNRFRTVVCSLGMGDRIKEKLDALDVKFVNFARTRRIDPKLIWEVKRLMKQEQIDVVMTTLFYADVVGALARVGTPVKAVLSWETISAPEWLRWHRLLAYRFAMRHCDKVISVSRATAKWLIEKRGLSEDKVIVIPYGVNLQLYRHGKEPELRKQLGLVEDTRVIGTVARLHPQKGHRYLIEASKSVVRQHPNVKFVLVGDGELRGQLEAQVRDAGLRDHYVFLGFRDDVKHLLRTFDLFVLPSLYEGLPNVVLEAMACGLPIVATAVDGTPELVVDGKTGFLAPPRDPDALSEKISLLLSDREKAAEFGLRGRQRVENHFSLDLQVSSFQDLYEKYAPNGVHRTIKHERAETDKNS